MGAGFIPARPGRRKATPFLLSPLGLGLRLQRTSIIAWAIGMLVLGASYGSVFGDLEAFFTDNEIMQQILPPGQGHTLTEQFLTLLMVVISILSTVPALMMILKLRGEENKNRTENLLTRAVSRNQLMASMLVISLFTGFIMLLLAMLGLWSAGTVVMEEPIPFYTAFNSAMVYLPAMWVMIGAAVLLIGIWPQATVLTWLYLGFSFFVVYLSGILQLPEWLAKLSPFGNIPQLPVEEMNYFSVIVMTVFALVLMIVGFKGYNNRDIQG
ncbi:hypothetical protein [Natranaerobius thermophilus]|uniref:ABC transporter permease n=1 Tax=Natranaerobius thermophilus TaxID=375929 RepID=UPI002F4094A3